MNVNDYLASYQVYSFKELPFNDVDNVILSHVAYLSWDGIIDKKTVNFSKACYQYFKKNNKDEVFVFTNHTLERRQMLAMMANSIRYKDMKLVDYVNDINKEEEKQFSAITIEVQPNLYYVAFKGTDGKIVSWKEDFNMAYLNPIPAQADAEEYLKRALLRRGQFIVGGHSKGGNLAVYASVKTNSRKIIKIYSNDGPGFSEEFVSSEPYQNMKDKMLSIVPENSVVGMLFNNDMQRRIVPTEAVDKLNEHDAITWKTDNADFKEIEQLSSFSRFLNESLMGWFSKLTLDEKVVCLDAIYQVTNDLGIETVPDLLSKKKEFVMAFIRSLNKYDDETKNLMVSTVLDLLKSSGFGLVDTYVIKKLSGISKEKVEVVKEIKDE